MGCEGAHVFLASTANSCRCAILSVVPGYGPGSSTVDLVQSDPKALHGSRHLPRLSRPAFTLNPATCELGSSAHPGARGDCSPGSGFQPGLDEVVE